MTHRAARTSGSESVEAGAKGQGATPMMAASYDKYFSSGLYQSRYPNPNPRTLRFLEHIFPHGGRLLDYGAGEGRYSLALMQSRDAQVLALDISATARTVLAHRADLVDMGHRIEIADPSTPGTMTISNEAEAYDVALLAFGVLAHIKGRQARLNLLTQLRAMLVPGGRLVLGLPNARRRFRAEQAEMDASPKPDGYEEGDIYYRRSSADGYVDLFYHLFDREQINRDLAEASFEIETLTAESVLPETMVTRYRSLSALDALLCRLVPVDLSYGYLVIAR